MLKDTLEVINITQHCWDLLFQKLEVSKPTHIHWIRFLDLFWIKWIPSNTLVMSYTLRFRTPSVVATSFKSRTPSGAFLRRAINLRVKSTKDASNRGFLTSILSVSFGRIFRVSYYVSMKYSLKKSVSDEV